MESSLPAIAVQPRLGWDGNLVPSWLCKSAQASGHSPSLLLNLEQSSCRDGSGSPGDEWLRMNVWNDGKQSAALGSTSPLGLRCALGALDLYSQWWQMTLCHQEGFAPRAPRHKDERSIVTSIAAVGWKHGGNDRSQEAPRERLSRGRSDTGCCH